MEEAKATVHDLAHDLLYRDEGIEDLEYKVADMRAKAVL